jgi:hypothetical protein
MPHVALVRDKPGWKHVYRGGKLCVASAALSTCLTPQEPHSSPHTCQESALHPIRVICKCRPVDKVVLGHVLESMMTVVTAGLAAVHTWRIVCNLFAHNAPSCGTALLPHIAACIKCASGRAGIAGYPAEWSQEYRLLWHAQHGLLAPAAD